MTPQPTIRALNLYYAREPGLREQVLATRLRASEVRAEIGIPRGRVFRRVEGDADLPDVMWDCPFADAAGHERDMDARAASAEFEAVRARMRAMLRRFGRVLYEIEVAAEPPAPNMVPSRIAQLWLERTGVAAIDAGPLRGAIASAGSPAGLTLLRQQGEDRDLPEWIIELRGDGHDAASRSLAAVCAALPGARVLASAWERRA